VSLEEEEVAVGRDDEVSASCSIDQSTARTVFGELVACALEELGTRVKPLVRSYLIELLDRQVAAPAPADAVDDGVGSLADELVVAREASGLERVPRLRDLGDRALFVAGFFRGSLRRRGLTRIQYVQVGRTAYSEVSQLLANRLAEPSWPELFGELANRFDEFEALLAEVGEFARPCPETELLTLYDRYVRTGSVRDRALLQQRGLMLPPRGCGLRC